MNRLKLASYIVLAIGVAIWLGIWLFSLVLDVVVPDERIKYHDFNFQFEIIALVLIVVSYFINRYSKKSETKQTTS